MILITGATGLLGRSVVEQISKHLEIKKFCILARNSEKASEYVNQGIDVRIADFNDKSSLEAAFQGIEKILLISTMEQNRYEQHCNVIDAAKKMRVQHIVYTGLAIKDITTSEVRELMESHFQTEEYLEKSGLEYTIVRNTMYADAIPMILGDISEKEQVNLSGGNGKVPYVLRREMGEAIANLLLKEDTSQRIYYITGSNQYSYQSVVETLNKINKTHAQYKDIPNNVYEAHLKEQGMPEFLIYLTKGTVVDIKNGQYEIDSDDLGALLGRPSLSLEEMLSELYN